MTKELLILLGPLLGVIASFIPNWLLEQHKKSEESKDNAKALIAEVAALISVARARKYLPDVKSVVAHLRVQPEGSIFKYEVMVPENYARVYRALLPKVGLLPSSLAVELIEFHQLVEAVATDLRPRGVVARGAVLDSFLELEQLFERIFELGDSIVQQA